MLLVENINEFFAFLVLEHQNDYQLRNWDPAMTKHNIIHIHEPVYEVETLTLPKIVWVIGTQPAELPQ